MVGLVPKMASFTKLGHVQIVENSSVSLVDFGLKQEAFDPATYKSALFSNVSNFIASGDKTITEPSNGYMTPRSPDGNEISNDNSILYTNRPIYKVEKLYLFPNKFFVKGLFGNTINQVTIDADDINRD
jgi:hypothetical protein